MNPAAGFMMNLFTAIAMICAGFAVAWKPRRWLTQTRLKSMMSLGAGYLITLIFVEILPQSMKLAAGHTSRAFAAVLGGTMTVFVFDRWVSPSITWFEKKAHENDGCAHHHEYMHDHSHQTHKNVMGPTPTHAHAACGHAILGHGAACSAVGCLIVCAFFDGIAFSGGMITDPELGTLIFAGQILHVIPEGLLASSLILAADGAPRTAKTAALITGTMFILGALVPGVIHFLPVLASLTTVVLPFSAGILLYVSLAQLLPASAATKIESGLVLAGGAGFAMLHTLIGHVH